MKKIFFGILISAPMFASQASIVEANGPFGSELYAAELNTEKSHFETLGDFFEAGKLPDLSRILNIAWAGRCFGKNDPNEPLNAGYIFREKAAADVGPIGANSKSYEALSYWNLSEAPNFFDALNLEQVYALNLKIDPYIARIESNSIEIDLTPTSKSTLRLFGKYLVEEISGMNKDVGPLGKVYTAIRCYYFIPELKP